MSQTVQTNEVVERFNEAFSHVEKGDEYLLTKDEVDGECWVSDTTIILYHEDELTEFGLVDYTEFEPSEYVRTESHGTDPTRCYGFTCGDHIEWVDVKFVRALANDVFGLEYSDLKDNAETIPGFENNRGNNISPVNFNIPDSPWHVSIAPYIPPEEKD